jgi:hypothetical protein
MRVTHLMSLGLCCIAISLCAASAFGQPADDASEWFVTPLPSGSPTPEDSAARQEVLRQIDKRQAADFRKQVMLKTLAVATGLPADYDIVVYGEYASRADRLEIQVRGNRARGEYFGTHTERRWAGEAPADALGPLTRQFIYGALTNHMPVAAAPKAQAPADDADSDPQTIELIEHETLGRIATRHNSYHASHAYQYRIEIDSRDPQRPLRIRTEARQTSSHQIELHSSGMRGYAHATYCNELLRWAMKHWPHAPLKDTAPQDVVRRLEAFAQTISKANPKLLERIQADDRDPLENIPSTDFDEQGVMKAIVEARILGEWAVAARAREAVGLLERLGRSTQARQVRIVTAEDGGLLWRQALVGPEWSDYCLTLETLRDKFNPLAIEVLLDSLPRLPDDFRAKEVLESLEGAMLSEEQLARVRLIHRETMSARTRVAAARLLLCKTDDDAMYRELCQKAIEPVKLDGSDVYSPVSDALYAVLAHTSKTPRRRAETAELIRTLLDRIPSDAHETYSRCDVLAVFLGKFGERRDLDRLESFVRQRSPYLADSAIAGIAYLDGRRASELARQQIVRFLEKSQENASYRWSVLPYLELFFWQRDQAAVPLLEKALAAHRSDPVYADDERPAERALLAYLRADRIDDRAAAAVRFHKQSWKSNPEWFDAVARDLIAAGADPAVCQPLLLPTNTGDRPNK